jgi:hypothetical protein
MQPLLTEYCATKGFCVEVNSTVGGFAELDVKSIVSGAAGDVPPQPTRAERKKMPTNSAQKFPARAIFISAIFSL